MNKDNYNSLTKEQDSKNTKCLKTSQLVLFDDDFNTFDWAIQSCMEVCNYTFDQSEQLCILVHYAGQAIIKTGSINQLKPMKEAFINRGISATIRTEEND